MLQLQCESYVCYIASCPGEVQVSRSSNAALKSGRLKPLPSVWINSGPAQLPLSP